MPGRSWSPAVLTALAVLGSAGTAHASPGCPGGDREPSAEATAEVETAVLCEMNLKRAEQGLVPLRRHPQLDSSARYHAHDMASFRYFAHRRADGPAVLTRIRATGYFDHVIGGLYTENIADAPEGRASAAVVTEAWMGSEYHRANLLTPAFRDAGIALEQVPADPVFYPSRPSVLVVVDYGRRYYRKPTPRCVRRRTAKTKRTHSRVCARAHRAKART